MSSFSAIRSGSISDLEELLRIERSCAETSHWSEQTWHSILCDTAHADSWHSVLVAEEGTAIVGFLVLRGTGDIAELENVVVSPAFRSQGLGRTLCLTAMKRAAKQGAMTMELEVRAASRIARALYVSLGFVEQGIRKAYYRSPVDDAVLMSVALPR